jgi:hypothetical protein
MTMPRTAEQLAQATRDARDWLDSVDPDEAEIQDADDLRQITTTMGQVAEAELLLHAAVKAARENGLSWGRIGMALGVSKQAARMRFGPDAPATEQAK